ncbi:MAG: hypothetical protein FD123_2970 [Bacteroidetes bacterium]|nr:MAG: hypothetical protein FD123_2970 [Bacteroidota bacterium]
MDQTTTLNFENDDLKVSNDDLLHFAEEDYPFEPAESTIRNILNYSKALEVKPSKNMQHFESVLN